MNLDQLIQSYMCTRCGDRVTPNWRPWFGDLAPHGNPYHTRTHSCLGEWRVNEIRELPPRKELAVYLLADLLQWLNRRS